MSALTVIGVDPGVTTGIAQVEYEDNALLTRPMLIQANAEAVVFTVECLIDRAWECAEPAEGDRIIVAYEKFVVRFRAGRLSDAQAGEVTRSLVGAIERMEGGQAGVTVTGRSAAEVKPWATDNRLNALGLGLAAGGMAHARDACRHALFAAVRDHGISDPLSRRAK